MAQIYILMGSPNDLDQIKAAGMGAYFDAVGVTYEVTVCSAHRNIPELEQYTQKALQVGARVFIGVAGMAAALPGALAGLTGMTVPVIAVPLDEHGIDSCIYMPPGVPVLTAGVGKAGLKNAAQAACQVLALGDEKLAAKLATYVKTSTKQPQYNVNLKESA